jgi:hypothetical protein
MVDGLHILTWNRTKEPLVMVLSGVRMSKRRDGGCDLTNVQCKAIWNCHNGSSLYSEYILIKNWWKYIPPIEAVSAYSYVGFKKRFQNSHHKYIF